MRLVRNVPHGILEVPIFSNLRLRPYPLILSRKSIDLIPFALIATSVLIESEMRLQALNSKIYLWGTLPFDQNSKNQINSESTRALNPGIALPSVQIARLLPLLPSRKGLVVAKLGEIWNFRLS